LHSQVKVIVYEMLYLLEIPKLTFKTGSCAPLEFFLHFSGIAACTKQSPGRNVSKHSVPNVLSLFFPGPT
ncbi:hypothetical protein NPM03_32275, partial [Bacillus cereus]